MSYRNSLLEGAKEAKRLHDILGAERYIDRTGGRIDVFGAAVDNDATLVFRKLSGLLGAYLKTEDGANGIIVTTQRRLAVQRFTGAHELGHMMMGHEPSLDREDILGSSASRLPNMEVEANGFAAEFLAPRWLLAHHCRNHEWGKSNMKDPTYVYQLSLRVGVSYDAVCRSLELNKIISHSTMNSLLSIQPKQIKRSIIPSTYTPENWYGDVWLLGEKDHGTRLEGHPDDVFVVRLSEKSSSGYLWNSDRLMAEGFEIYCENRANDQSENLIGGDVGYEVVFGSAPSDSGTFNLAQTRPWEVTRPLGEIEISYDVFGKEEGMSRAERRCSLAA